MIGYKAAVMVFHAAELIAVWIQAAQQNPVPVQVQNVPERSLAIASWIGPVISGLLSFFVAWMVFHWQGKKEHKQWVRDQKISEWKNLIKHVTEFDRLFPVQVKDPDFLESLLPQLKWDIVDAIMRARSECFTITATLMEGEADQKFSDYICQLDNGFNFIHASFQTQNRVRDRAHLANWAQALYEEKKSNVDRYANLRKIHELFKEWILLKASEDLQITTLSAFLRYRIERRTQEEP